MKSLTAQSPGRRLCGRLAGAPLGIVTTPATIPAITLAFAERSASASSPTQHEREGEQQGVEPVGRAAPARRHEDNRRAAAHEPPIGSRTTRSRDAGAASTRRGHSSCDATTGGSPAGSSTSVGTSTCCGATSCGPTTCSATTCAASISRDDGDGDQANGRRLNPIEGDIVDEIHARRARIGHVDPGWTRRHQRALLRHRPHLEHQARTPVGEAIACQPSGASRR
jgi:hypothetical protein